MCYVASFFQVVKDYLQNRQMAKFVLDNDGSEIEDSDDLLEVKGETMLFLEGEEEQQPEE